MLNCLLCPATFDDKKEIKHDPELDGDYPPPNAEDNVKRRAVSDSITARQRKHSAEQNKWRQFRGLFDNGLGGEDHVVHEHICPACSAKVKEGSVKLAWTSQGGA